MATPTETEQPSSPTVQSNLYRKKNEPVLVARPTSTDWQ